MINRVVLIGRLARDADLRTTGSGKSVASFTLAVDRQFTNAQGKLGADFINCVIWNKSAENLVNFAHKGSLIGIDGRIQTRTYDGKNGNHVYVTEVIVDQFSLLESKNSVQISHDAKTFNDKPSPSHQDEARTMPDPFKDSGQTLEISNEDLPF